MLASLPSVTAQTLGKEAILVPECIDFGHVSALPSIFTLALGKNASLSSVTLGKEAFCRVPGLKHSASVHVAKFCAFWD